MLNRAEVYDRCLERWDSSDKRTEYFSDHFEEWFSQIPEEIQDVVLELLELFEYYSQSKTNQCLMELHPKLQELESFDDDQAIYTPLVSQKGIANSSDDYLYTYKQIHGISKYKVVRDLNVFSKRTPEKLSAIKNIVIVDDFCGSGSSLREFLEGNIELLRGKHIYYLVTYIMEASLPEITKIANDFELEIDVLYINMGKKALDNEKFSDNADALRLDIKKKSKKLNIHRYYRLGKYDSESLVAFHNDTPNNTIGLFWYDSVKYFSIFPREFEDTNGLKRPTPKSLKEQKEAREVQNYCSAARRAQYE